MVIKEKILIPTPIEPLINRLISMGYTPLLIGGYVRDSLLEIPCLDIDIELYNGPSLNYLYQRLKAYTPIIDTKFGILKLKIHPYLVDLGLPRRENKISVGHTGFSIDLNPKLGLHEAAKRRDFTVNTLAFDIKKNLLLDPFNGLSDLQEKKLCAVGPSFEEDSLRVFRAMQFAGRLEFSIEKKTLTRCSKIRLNDLPKERIFEEFKKLFLCAKKPSLGLQYIHSLGILNLFPNYIERLYRHDSLWKQSLRCVDIMAKIIPEDHPHKLEFMLAAWFQGLSNESGSTQIIQDAINRISDNKKYLNFILKLIKHYLIPDYLYQKNLPPHERDLAIRTLVSSINVTDVLYLSKAYALSTKFSKKEFPAEAWLLVHINRLGITNGIHPLLTGQDLKTFGILEGPIIGSILKKVFKLQLNGSLNTRSEALKWIQSSIIDFK